MKTLVLRSIAGEDHLNRVAAALLARGVHAERWFLEGLPGCVYEGCGGVVLADCCGPWALEAIRRARAHGSRVVQVLDGVCEWRNMFLNRASPGGFLRPAPVDTVCCAGAQDRIVLEHFGNRARATGLPRLDVGCVGGSDGIGRVLVCSARRAWFTDNERERVLGALDQVRRCLEHREVEIIWRVSREVSSAMGVERSDARLVDDLSAVGRVITLPSTVLIEGIIAGKPTALLHPFESPCWLPSVWRIGQGVGQGSGIAKLDTLHDGVYLGDECHGVVERVNDVLESLLEPDASAMDAQRRVSSILHEEGDASTQVSEIVIETCGRDPGPGVSASLATIARLPSAPAAGCGVAVTLRVVMQPEHAGEAMDAQECTCVVDPVWDIDTRLEHVTRTLEFCPCDRATVCDGASERVVDRGASEGDESFASRIVGVGSQDRSDSEFREALDALVARGYGRIACFGVGRFTQSVMGSVRESDPIIGFIDDGSLEHERFLGMTMVRPERAIEVLEPDCVLICSDAHDDAIRARCDETLGANLEVFGVDELSSGVGAKIEIKTARDGHDGLGLTPSPVRQSGD